MCFLCAHLLVIIPLTFVFIFEVEMPPTIPVVHLELVYLVTALVPSDTACLASSPGSRSLTAVCTSRLVMVERLLYCASLEASVAMRSNTSLTNEFMMLIALLEMPVSGWTCTQIRYIIVHQYNSQHFKWIKINQKLS